jgi:hypothetical protein
VEFDISLPQVPCSLLNIDANDPTGQTQSLHLDRKHHVWKHRIKVDQKGTTEFIGDRAKLELGSTLLKEEHLMEELEKLNLTNNLEEATDTRNTEVVACGSCYGAGEEGECCDTCDDVKRAYNRRGWHIRESDTIDQCQNEGNKDEEGEGCNVHGVVSLSTGGGSFHLAPGRSLDSFKKDASGAVSIFDILMKTFEQWNVSHTVHKISFGDEFPGHVHQLDGETRSIVDSYGMYQYYFQVRHIEKVEFLFVLLLVNSSFALSIFHRRLYRRSTNS